MIHARIIDGVAEERRGEITLALMGRAAPAPPTRERRLPPVGQPVRELPRGNLAQTMAQLQAIMPGGGKP